MRVSSPRASDLGRPVAANGIQSAILFSLARGAGCAGDHQQREARALAHPGTGDANFRLYQQGCQRKAAPLLGEREQALRACNRRETSVRKGGPSLRRPRDTTRLQAGPSRNRCRRRPLSFTRINAF